MKKFWSWLIDCIYPRFCYSCGKMGEFLCDDCYNQLDFLRQSDITETTKQLSQKQQQEFYLDQVQALLNYDSLTSKILHQYKYLGVKDLSQTVAYWLYQFTMLPKIDVVTYVPIHKKRLAERGYNQAKLMAEELATMMNVPCQPLLKRSIHRQNQAMSKNKYERWQKAQDIFDIQIETQKKINKKATILIVDDVITTGATLNQAAKVIKMAGFQKVCGLALAHGS